MQDPRCNERESWKSGATHSVQTQMERGEEEEEVSLAALLMEVALQAHPLRYAILSGTQYNLIL